MHFTANFRRLGCVFAALLWLGAGGCARLPGDTLAAAASTPAVLTSRPSETPPVQATASRPPPTPGSTPQPQVTPASTPTRIGSASAASPALTQTQAQSDSKAPLLALNFDVLYLRQGSLVRWSHVGKQLDTIFGPSEPGLSRNFEAETAVYPGEVIEFATDARQRRVIAQVNRGVSANGIGLYDLLLIDLERSAVRTVLAETRWISRFSLSPDGGLLAYLHATDQQIHVLRLDGEPQPKSIAGCQAAAGGDCSPVWSASGKYLAWADAQGVWQAQAPGWQAVLVSPLMLSMVDIDGSQREVQVHAGRLVWSSFDRYLLAEVSPAGGASRWLAVVDMRTGRADAIPGVIFPAGASLPAAWLDYERLIVMRSDPETRPGRVLVGVWQIFPARQSQTLSLQTSLELSSDAVEFADLQVIANRFLLFRAQDEAGLAGWLGRLDLDYRQLNWTLPLPGATNSAAWAPDGSGAFLLASPDIGLYAPVGGSDVYDLRAWFGEELSRLVWCQVTGKAGSEGGE